MDFYPLLFLCGAEAKMVERNFQANLIKKIKALFDGCIVLKNDPEYVQGIPDLLILYKNKWAALECKKASKASRRPNQEYYVSKMNEMSFASFISPENEEEVLNDLQQAFRVRRSPRISRSK